MADGDWSGGEDSIPRLKARPSVLELALPPVIGRFIFDWCVEPMILADGVGVGVMEILVNWMEETRISPAMKVVFLQILSAQGHVVFLKSTTR